MSHVAEELDQNAIEPGRHSNKLQSSMPSHIQRGPAFDPDFLRKTELRTQTYASHPLVTDLQRLPTATVVTVFGEIRSAIVHRMPTVFFAPGRTGKSRTKLIVRDLLHRHHPDIPTGMLNAKAHDRPTEAAFWGDAMADFKIVGPTSARGGAMRQRVISAIVAQCSAAESTSYALLLDEIQEWGPQELTYLRDAENLLLESYGVSLIPISFAQPQVDLLYQRLKSDKRVDLINRYLQKRMALPGMASLKSAEQFLGLLDDPRHDFPASTGICYTEFFLPELFAAGFRMQGQARFLWDALNAASIKHVKEGSSNVGWKWVCNACRNFLYSHLKAVDIDQVGTLEQWSAAIEGAGYVESLFG